MSFRSLWQRPSFLSSFVGLAFFLLHNVTSQLLLPPLLLAAPSGLLEPSLAASVALNSLVLLVGLLVAVFLASILRYIIRVTSFGSSVVPKRVAVSYFVVAMSLTVGGLILFGEVLDRAPIPFFATLVSPIAITAVLLLIVVPLSQSPSNQPLHHDALVALASSRANRAGERRR